MRAVVAVFLLLISAILEAQHMMKITSLTSLQWSMIIGAIFIGMFWVEIKLMIILKSNIRWHEGVWSG